MSVIGSLYRAQLRAASRIPAAFSLSRCIAARAPLRMRLADAVNGRNCCIVPQQAHWALPHCRGFSSAQRTFAAKSNACGFGPHRNCSEFRKQSLTVQPARKGVSKVARCISTTAADPSTAVPTDNGAPPKYTRRTSIKDVKVPRKSTSCTQALANSV